MDKRVIELKCGCFEAWNCSSSSRNNVINTCERVAWLTAIVFTLYSSNAVIIVTMGLY